LALPRLGEKDGRQQSPDNPQLMSFAKSSTEQGHLGHDLQHEEGGAVPESILKVKGESNSNIDLHLQGSMGVTAFTVWGGGQGNHARARL